MTVGLSLSAYQVPLTRRLNDGAQSSFNANTRFIAANDDAVVFCPQAAATLIPASDPSRGVGLRVDQMAPPRLSLNDQKVLKTS